VVRSDDYRRVVSIREATLARRVGLAISVFVISIIASIAPTPGTRAATPVNQLNIRLIAQNFNVATNRQLRFVFSVTDESQRAALATDPSASISIGFLTPLTSREAVRASLVSATSSSTVASLDLRFSQLTRNANGDFTAITSLIGPLRALKQGIYPVALRISRGGSVASTTTTFVNLFEPDSQFQPLPVSALVSVESQPTMQPDGSTEVPLAARTQLEALAALLESFDGRISVHISPQLVDGLRRSARPEDQALFARLETVFPRHELLPTTYVSYDAASALRNNLTDEFAEQLLQGETTLDAVNGETPLLRRIWFSRVSIDRDAVTLLRQLGVQTIVLTPQGASPIGPIDSYVKPYRAVGSNSGVAVGLRSVDPLHAQWLTDQTREPLINAYALAAEIIIQQQSIVNALGDPRDRHVVVSTLNGNIAPLGVLSPLVVALNRAPQLQMVPLSQVTTSLNDATNLNLPMTDRVDLGGRQEALAALRNEIASTSTMLVVDAPQHFAWRVSLLTTATDTLTTEQFEAYQRGLRAQLRALRNSVKIPEALTFTLGGRESDLRMQLRNEADQQLSVLVTVESAKLQFPDGPQLVTIPARSSIDIVIPVVARANGTFPLDVVLKTPDGSTTVGRRIQMTARVSALAGLGQVVTGAAILILLSWWVSHWRTKRRGDSVKNHPAVH